MMGRLKRNQGQFFYSFCLDEVVPDDHRVREIAGVLDLSSTRRSRVPATSGSARVLSSGGCSSVLWRRALRRAWLAAKALRSMRA